MSSLSLIFSKGTLPRAQSRGFTLVEMMVVVSIIIIMTGVVLAGLPGFRDRSSLDLVAQEVALVIRQAQAFGSQTRFAATAFPSYGIYFNPGNVAGVPSGGGTANASFSLFADADRNGHYNGPGAGCGTANSECREVYNLSGGITLSGAQLCNKSGATETCQPPNPNYLNIVFNRPNPEAHFADNNSSSPSNLNNLDNSCPPGSSSCSYAKITLSSPKISTPRNICIWSTGHIYVTSSASC